MILLLIDGAACSDHQPQWRTILCGFAPYGGWLQIGRSARVSMVLVLDLGKVKLQWQKPVSRSDFASTRFPHAV